MQRPHRRWLLSPVYAIAAIVLVFEDFLWDPLQRSAAWILARLHLDRLERWIGSLRPYPALALFVVPSALLFPVKLGALSLMAHGMTAAGVSLLIGAKIAGTAVVARLFTLCRPALLSVAWFARLYEVVVRLRERALAILRASIVGRAARQIREQLRGAMTQIMRAIRS